VIDAGFVARLLLGAVFLWAGVAKVRTAHWRLLAIEAGTPRTVVIALPAIEAMLGLALVLQVATSVVPWVAIALLLVFTATLAQRYVTGNTAPCNCFGGKSNDPVDYTTFVRNASLVALGLIAALN
jgi:uncharacterized membrane protein YphA (DoxX/SURF4 family)